MDSRQYESAAHETLSSIDDTAKAKLPINALIDFAVAAKKIDLIKRHAYYAKKPDAAKRAGPAEYREKILLDITRDRLVTGELTVAESILRAEINKNLMHAMIGIATEAGEIIEALLDAIVYGRPLDLENLREEFGDMEWYEAEGRTAARELANSENPGSGQIFDLEAIWRANIAKLRARYSDPAKVAGHGDRDLAAEQAAVKAADVSGK